MYRQASTTANQEPESFIPTFVFNRSTLNTGTTDLGICLPRSSDRPSPSGQRRNQDARPSATNREPGINQESQLAPKSSHNLNPTHIKRKDGGCSEKKIEAYQIGGPGLWPREVKTGGWKSPVERGCCGELGFGRSTADGGGLAGCRSGRRVTVVGGTGERRRKRCPWVRGGPGSAQV